MEDFSFMEPNEVFQKVVNLCERRGLVMRNSEIYSALSGIFDYGPLAVQIRKNLENSWRKFFVQERDDVVEIDGSILSNPMVWKASGHIDTFHDALVECKNCHSRLRADHVLEEALKIPMDGIPIHEMKKLFLQNKVKCPICGKPEFSEPNIFSLMLKTHIGPIQGDSSTSYLRPETAQNIFIDFKQVALANRLSLPFGIAQFGKMFRNEISPRNFLFRQREFYCYELEFFIHSDKMNACNLGELHLNKPFSILTDKMQLEGETHKQMTFNQMVAENLIKTKWHVYWLAKALEWFELIGIKRENLRLRQHLPDEKSHYSVETWDWEYNFSFGFKEIFGCANRGNFDLTQHQNFSKKDLTLFIEDEKKKILPHVIEPSFGFDRIFLAVLNDSFQEKKDEKGEIRIILSLNPISSPLQVSIFPLMKKDGMSEKAREVYNSLKKDFLAYYDEGGSIGKRYARVDEIGCNYCITIDYDTLKDGTVTIRERDTAKQKRIAVTALNVELQLLLLGKSKF